MHNGIPLRVVHPVNDLNDSEAVQVENPGDEITADGVYVNGEPVITTGRDVSQFLVDLRDDGDPAVTFRALFIGTLFGCLGAAANQMSYFISYPGTYYTYCLLLIYIMGITWSRVLPRRSHVEGTKFAVLGPVLGFINHGDFRIKEHFVATLIATRASDAFDPNIENIYAVEQLYYNTDVQVVTTVIAISTAFFGCGLCGLLQPLIVNPSEMVYWTNLPVVSILQSLHFHSADNYICVQLFWSAFVGMLLWEAIPAYIFPLLNGINIFCLASQHAPQDMQDIITNLFGGARSDEGLGLLSISLDWQHIALGPNSWIGIGLCYIILSIIYYSNIWNSKSFPMLSTALFSLNGSDYDQPSVFGTSLQLNQTALNEVGLPFMTGSNVWSYIAASLAIGGLFAHCVCFWGPYIQGTFKHACLGTQPDPHWKAIQRYKEVPYIWYICLIILSLISGFVVVLTGKTAMSWYSYVVAVLLGLMVTPFAQIFRACMGNGIDTSQLMMMIGAIMKPGNPVAILFFAMCSHGILKQSCIFGGNLKVSQYLKIPPQVTFFAMIWGTILVIMASIVSSKGDLLTSNEASIWSNVEAQTIHNDAMTWALVKQLYGPSGPYFIVPMALLIGMISVIIQWLIFKRSPRIGPVKVDNVILPIIYQYSGYLSYGVTSPVTSVILVGAISQFWLRRYHPGWFRKYNYILGLALDAASQLIIIILSFTVFGLFEPSRPFPIWAGNPAGNSDYCNGNGHLA
ncbi:OPT oligopeptide transporter protein-domain-containing protein [Scleroderma yunnanense]